LNDRTRTNPTPQTFAPETKIVMRGYENGRNHILQLKAMKIKPKVDAYGFDGEFEESIDIGAPLRLNFTETTKTLKMIR